MTDPSRTPHAPPGEEQASTETGAPAPRQEPERRLAAEGRPDGKEAPDFSVRLVSFGDAETRLRAIRQEVFIREQAVPEAEEWDGLDPDCVHALAETRDGTPVGTGRLAPGGKVGRMAVRAPFRGRGVGSALLQTLVSHAEALGVRQVVLDAQLQAIPFYERHGFRAEGGVFLDAGIPHRRMRRSLGERPATAAPPPRPGGDPPR